ncbi:MAG: isoprenylcysteine carboxylmethyltransferase family protein [Dehalococcoidia bacterium]|nr:isoprenylcysteine carboxylmethyltransferase family protein [Dehalococcoidia bacterium]
MELAVMIAWINLAVLIVSAVLFLYFYIKSVGPAALERKIGEVAYARCKQYRLIASAFESIALLNYIIYFFYPLPLSLPLTFPWEYWISVLIALGIGIPGGWLMTKGLIDAGEESLAPKKEHTLYGGIYKKIRHPQAAGEVTLWWVASFMLNSPFLAIISFLWLPVFYIFCRAEEKDLVIRYGEAYLNYMKNTGFVLPRRNMKS